MAGLVQKAGALKARWLLAVEARGMTLGRMVGQRPWTVLLGSMLVALSCSCGLLQVSLQTNFDKTWVPQGLDAVKQQQQLDAAFGPQRVRMANALFTAKDGGSVLRTATWNAIITEHERVLSSIQVSGGGRASGTTYQDVCQRRWSGGPCRSENIVWSLFQGNFTLARAAPEATLLQLVNQYEKELNMFVGGITRDGSGTITSVSIVQFFYAVKVVDEDTKLLFPSLPLETERVLDWESAFLKEVNGWEPSPLSALPINGLAVAWRTLFDEAARATTGATPLIVASIMSMLVFMSVALGPLGWPLLHSRILLGSAALLSVLLAEVMGFGLGALFVPFTEITLLLVFLIVGVGVDDVIILVDAFDETDGCVDTSTRMEQAMRKAFPTMLVTSLTNLIAFLVASTVDFPVVRFFTVMAAFCIFSVFFLTVTFFAALLVFDERRQSARRADLCPCVRVTSPASIDGSSIGLGVITSSSGRVLMDHNTAAAEQEEEQEQEEEKDKEKEKVASGKRDSAATNTNSMAARVAAQWGDFVTKRNVAISVTALFVALSAACALSVTNIPLGIPLSDAFPDDSYYLDYFDTMEAKFKDITDETVIYVENQPIWMQASQDRVQEMAQMFAANSEVTPPVLSWVSSFKLWSAFNGLPTTNTSAVGFSLRVQEFLQSAPFVFNGTAVQPKSFQRDVHFSPDGSIDAFLLRTRIKVSPEVVDRVHTWRVVTRLRKQFSDVEGFVWSFSLVFSERDSLMVKFVLTTLALAALAIVGSVALFVSMRVVVVVTLCLLATDLLLFGEMWLWDVPLDAATFILLATSLGLSVDYVVHIGHSFENFHGSSPAAARHSLVSMGYSVFKGGSSTFLGVVVLAFAKSGIFRIFFRLLFGIVLFGMLSGFALFPAAASLLPADSRTQVSNKEEEHV